MKIEDLETIVCDHMDVDKMEVLTKKNKRKLSTTRRLIWYFGYSELGIPSFDIEKRYGRTKRDVMFAINNTRKARNTDTVKELRAEVLRAKALV